MNEDKYLGRRIMFEKLSQGKRGREFKTFRK